MPDMIRELTSSGLFFLPTAIVSVVRSGNVFLRRWIKQCQPLI